MTAKAALPEPGSRTSVLPAPGCPWPWLSLSLVAALALSRDRRARGRSRWAPLRPRAGPCSVLNIHRDRYFLKGESAARETSQPRGRTKEGLCSCTFPRLGKCSPSPLCPLGLTLRRVLEEGIILALSDFSWRMWKERWTWRRRKACPLIPRWLFSN